MEIIGFGEAMVLFQPANGATLDAAAQVGVYVAGAELNLCAAAARTGVRAGFCSRVGADPLGARVIGHARRMGVDTGLIRVDPAYPTGLFVKDVRPDGQRRVHYYRTGSAASMMDSSDARRLLATRPRLVAISGITPALGPGPRDAVRELVRAARPAGIAVAFDPNLRPALGPIEHQVGTARELLPYVDFLVLGLDEAGPLLGTATPADVFGAARAAGVRETVVKAGAEGCFHLAGDVEDTGSVTHQPSAARAVVDPVGAGDAFAGGYLAARLCGAPPAGAAWLGLQLAAGVVGTTGDTEGLPDRAAAAELLSAALAR